jgi:hypothetical protein
LLNWLYDDQWEKKDARTDKLAYQGYDDLSGQLNATLDFFPSLTLGSLTSISIIVGVLCLIIGPLDYLVVSRAWKRPRGTWITLLICSLGSSFLAAGMTQAWKPTTPSINSLELIDIDFQNQTVSGRGFARCYGGQRGAFDITAYRRRNGFLDATGKSLSVQLDWYGQPGKGLGGFDSTVATDRGMPAYRIDLANASVAADNTDQVDAKALPSDVKIPPIGIRGVGIPFAGTKAMFSSWEESIAITKQMHSLSMVAGSIDLLEGEVTNPLEIDLLDAILIYRGRAYALPTRIRPGESLSFASTTVPKDITRRLQRRQNVAGEEKNSPWDPADTSKLGRLTELISFHKAASGSNYTNLYNRYLGALDCSDVVRQDRAILFAEAKDATLSWSILRNSVPIQAAPGQRKTFLRLVIPVSKPIKNNNSVRAVNPASQP